MTYTKVRYSPTPMLGWRDKDTYELDTYHVAPLRSLSHLSLEEAQMVAAFMNRLKDDRSIRAIEARVFMGNVVEGLDKLLKPRQRRPTLLDPSEVEDILKLKVVEGAIVWKKDSILEGYENNA
jgi:hypothetical protein